MGVNTSVIIYINRRYNTIDFTNTQRGKVRLLFQIILKPKMFTYDNRSIPYGIIVPETVKIRQQDQL